MLLTNTLPSIVRTAAQTSRGLLDALGIDRQVFVAITRDIECAYLPNPYHNAIHGADVLLSCHQMLLQTGLENRLTDFEVFMLLFSAVAHDVGHPGTTGQFQINSGSEIALTYNDRSCLENMHAAKTFKIVRQNLSQSKGVLFGQCDEEGAEGKESDGGEHDKAGGDGDGTEEDPQDKEARLAKAQHLRRQQKFSVFRTTVIQLILSTSARRGWTTEWRRRGWLRWVGWRVCGVRGDQKAQSVSGGGTDRRRR